MLTLIDNYDSFTYNLVHFLGELGAATRVYRNDKITVDEVLAEAPGAIVLSPGPCDPDRAGMLHVPRGPGLGVVLDEAAASPRASFTPNREARHPLSKEALPALMQCLTSAAGAPDA